MKILKMSLKILFISFFIFVSFNLIGYLYAIISPKIDIRSANQFYIYDKDEKLVLSGNENKDWISIDSLNPLVLEATVSVEDKNFYNHNGFDFMRIVKALMANAVNGKIVQGASTISQQYAKNLFLNFDQTWQRKWNEMWLTYKLENNYSKDEILEGYLNTINYGNGVYGIGKAAKYYYNKDINDLDLAEISILVGIPNSPTNYSPVNNLDLSKKRQEVVLSRMVDNGYISEDDKKTALEEELTFYGEMENYTLSSIMYYRDAVMKELDSIEQIPKDYLETGGLRIYTKLDIDAQKALEDGALLNEKFDKLQTAKIMMDAEDGSIIALIGGTNYDNSSYNRATDAVRQPGSLVKPFLYYKAIENGLTPSSLFLSEKTSFNFSNGTVYEPKNSGNIYADKEITMALALAYSDNIYAVKTHLFLGENELYDLLIKLGITSKIQPTPSLALGSYEVNMLDLSAVYASLANLGKTVKPHLIEKVYDINNNLIYEYKDEGENVLNASIVFIINEMLTGTYDRNLIDYTYPTCMSMVPYLTHKYAIKSGSTDSDAWVVGYTDKYVLASWAGYDDNSIVSSNIVVNNKESWAVAMEAYLKNKETSWPSVPNDVVALLVNPINGKLATVNSKNKKIQYYLKGTEPVLEDN